LVVKCITNSSKVAGAWAVIAEAVAWIARVKSSGDVVSLPDTVSSVAVISTESRVGPLGSNVKSPVSVTVALGLENVAETPDSV
jgi:hypothetical protein